MGCGREEGGRVLVGDPKNALQMGNRNRNCTWEYVEPVLSANVPSSSPTPSNSQETTTVSAAATDAAASMSVLNLAEYTSKVDDAKAD